MKNTESAQLEIGKQIISLQNHIGLNNMNFYLALDASAPTLKKILLSDDQVYIDLYIQVGFLFGMRLEELVDRTLILPVNFRELVIDFHTFIGSNASEHINKRPATNYAINRLLKTKALNDYKKGNEIKIAIYKLLGHSYNVSTISTELKKFNDRVDWRPAFDNSDHKEYKLKLYLKEESTEGYIPSYIKLAKYLSNNFSLINTGIVTPFERIYKMFEILIKVINGPKTGEELLLGFKDREFNQTNVASYLTPLVENGLIITRVSVGGNDFDYTITDKGSDVLNLKR